MDSHDKLIAWLAEMAECDNVELDTSLFLSQLTRVCASSVPPRHAPSPALAADCRPLSRRQNSASCDSHASHSSSDVTQRQRRDKGDDLLDPRVAWRAGSGVSSRQNTFSDDQEEEEAADVKNASMESVYSDTDPAGELSACNLSPNLTPNLNPNLTHHLSPNLIRNLSPNLTPHLSPNLTRHISPKLTADLSPNLTHHLISNLNTKLHSGDEIDYPRLNHRGQETHRFSRQTRSCVAKTPDRIPSSHHVLHKSLSLGDLDRVQMFYNSQNFTHPGTCSYGRSASLLNMKIHTTRNLCADVPRLVLTKAVEDTRMSTVCTRRDPVRSRLGKRGTSLVVNEKSRTFQRQFSIQPSMCCSGPSSEYL